MKIGLGLYRDSLTPENFRDLVFVNPAMLHLSMNPDYFRGTVIEDAASKLLRHAPQPAAAKA